MSGSDKDQTRAKPDGSAYKTHMDDLERRNAQTRREGQARRKAHDLELDASRRATEIKQNASLRGKGTRKGKAQLT